MKPADVTSALATRKTVRVTYSRSTELYRVEVLIGDEVLESLLSDLVTEDLAERYADLAATAYDLPLTRVDVP